MKIDEKNLIYGLIKTKKGYVFVSKKKDEIYNLIKTIMSISKHKESIKQPFPLDYEVDDNNQVHIFLNDSTIITDIPSYRKK